MANSDKNIVITPNIGSSSADPKIVFSGADSSLGPQNITLQVYPTDNGTLSFEGSAGQLFSITNNMSGTIYSVNDVSGIPSIEVLDTGLVKLAQYGGNVLIGTGIDNATDKLQVNGSILGTTIRGTQLVSSVSTGTAPLIVNSTTMVNNLNAQYWNGNSFSNYLNQGVRTGDSPTFADVYTNGWFRTYNETGLYNQTHGNHWYATSNQYWNAAGNSTDAVGIVIRTGGHQGTVRGYLYANSANQVGILDEGGSWAIKHVNDEGTYFSTDGDTVELRVGRDTVSGDYGTVQTDTYRNGWSGFSILGRVVFMHDGGGGWGIYNDVGNTWMLYSSSLGGSLQRAGNTIWDAGNDGSGSGLDADLLDGNHASAFAATNQTFYLGTTQVAINRSSGVQSLTGISGISMPDSNDGNFIDINITAAKVTLDQPIGGSITIQAGIATPASSSADNLLGGGIGIFGGDTDVGTVLANAIHNAGAVYIRGGRVRSTATNSFSKTGGSVYIDGGSFAAGGSNNIAGTVYIGNNPDGLTEAATKEVIIGKSGTPVKLPGVGTSGFVKLGAEGQLSADTNTYALSNHTHSYGTVTSVGGTGTVSGLTLSGTVTTSGNLTLGGTLSASIDNLTDEHRIFNNMGDNHGTRTSFDASAPSYNFGWRFVQGSTNGPGVNSATQYYSLYVGLGNEYGATGAGSYGMQLAIPRNVATPYLAIRYNENNSLGSWQKINAGYADTSGNATTATTLQTSRTITIGNTGKSFNGSANVSWSLSEIGAAATNQTFYLGTTQVAINRSSGIQSLTGISGISMPDSNDGNFIDINITAAKVTLDQPIGGSITIQAGIATPASSSADNLLGGGIGIFGGDTDVGTVLANAIHNAGAVYIRGGRVRSTATNSFSKTGGSVYIDGGSFAAGGSNNIAGTVYIGNNPDGLTEAATKEVIIGKSGTPVKLPGVGTSGFVKLGTGGQLSADTNTYAVSSHTHNYAGSSSAGGAANSVANSLTIQFNGTSQTAYNGSSAVTHNITPSAIGASVNIQEFSTVGSSTWTKPSGAKLVHILMYGGGGGGGSGRRRGSANIATQACAGGGGGGGGGRLELWISASQLSSTETVVVGGGGAGGSSVTVDGTNGSNGIDGENSSFGIFQCRGGDGGLGGTTVTSSVSGGEGGTAIDAVVFTATVYRASGGNNNTGSAATAGGRGGLRPGGGGGANGNTATLESSINGTEGGAGGSVFLGQINEATSGSYNGGGSAGISSGTLNGGNGANSYTNNYGGGDGGGSGAFTSTAAGNGGNGGFPGGGGGGGAPASGSFNSGVGGSGAGGFVRVTTFF